MQVTLKDIAQKSGFSVTTVSRALAGYSDVNEQTRQHIITIASEAGYQPNLLARQFRSQRTHTLGIIVPVHDYTFISGFYSQLMLGIGAAASHEHYDLLISAQDTEGEDEVTAYRRVVAGNRVDGMILARTRQNDARIQYLKAQNHPFVVAGRAAPGEISDFPFIDVDSQSGIQLVVDHFVGLGHRDIGLILPPPEMAFTGYRHEGYREGLEAAGIPYNPDYVVNGDLWWSGGYQGAQVLLDRHPQVTAIIASNDLMAIGAISLIQSKGLAVGRDIAVSGFDDIPAAEFSYPSLTTIHQPIYEIGQRLVKILTEIITGVAPQQMQVILPGTLVVRASSGFQRQLY